VVQRAWRDTSTRCATGTGAPAHRGAPLMHPCGAWQTTGNGEFAFITVLVYSPDPTAGGEGVRALAKVHVIGQECYKRCQIRLYTVIMKLTDDIRSVTDLKRKTREILDQVHRTGRPVILTVNGKADAVLMDAKTFEMRLAAGNMARLLAPAEKDVRSGRTRRVRSFLREFKVARKIPR